MDVAVLESLYQHRLLSTRQVHVLHAPGARLREAQRSLARLREAELAASVRVPGGLGLWYLTPRGLDAVETIPSRAELRRKVIRPEQAAGPLQQHTLGVNDVGIAFVRAARERGHECGPYAWRHEIGHSLGPPPGRRQADFLIADAVLTYELADPGAGISVHYRFLELDRATIPTADLAAKLARYSRLYRHATPADDHGDPPVPLWTRHYPVFPTVLAVLAHESRDRLERRRQVVLALCRENPELRETADVAVSVCLLEDLASRGPFAPIFRAAADPDTPTDWLGDDAV